MPSQDIGSVPHEVGQSLACVWGPLRAQHGTSGGRFPTLCPVHAVDGRFHAYTDRERERDRDAGRGRGGYTAAETVIVEHCTTVGELIVIKC